MKGYATESSICGPAFGRWRGDLTRTRRLTDRYVRTFVSDDCDIAPTYNVAFDHWLIRRVIACGGVSSLVCLVARRSDGRSRRARSNRREQKNVTSLH
jgi:hypothetical protein